MKIGGSHREMTYCGFTTLYDDPFDRLQFSKCILLPIHEKKYRKVWTRVSKHS